MVKSSRFIGLFTITAGADPLQPERGEMQLLRLKHEEAVTLYRQLDELLHVHKPTPRHGDYACDECGAGASAVYGSRGCDCGGTFQPQSTSALMLDGEWTAEMAAECRRAAAR